MKAYLSTRRFLLAALVAASLHPWSACAQDHGAGHNHAQPKASAAAVPHGGCEGPELACALTATPAFDARDRLWITWSAQSKVWVAYQDAAGGPFGTAIAITPSPVRLDSGPDSRPKIVIDNAGRVVIAFATLLPEVGHYGQIFTSASHDDGKMFSAPKRLDPASPGHRFEALQFLPDGSLFAATIDKASAVAAKKARNKYAGAALSYAISTDGGLSFAPARIAVEHSCECCRISMALNSRREPVVLFRNIFDGTTRDHAIVTFAADGTPGPLRRISVDEWVTDTCPHQGPAITITPADSIHVVWYTAGKARKGVFYARSVDSGVTFSQPRALGRKGVQVSRPQVLSSDKGLVLAWKEFDGETASAVVQTSHDDGLTWSAPVAIAQTKGRADHPQLIANTKGVPYLSWLTDAEGHRMLLIGGAS